MNSQKNWNLNKSSDKNNSNLNKSFQYNPRERLMSILKRISESDPVLMTKLTFLKERKKRSYIFQIKNKNESDFNEISNNMSMKEKELLSHVNEFKQDVIDFEKSENKNFSRYAKYKKNNDYFSKLYKSFQKKKKKRGDTSFLGNEFYFDIANKYLLNNKRLPDMKRNVFNSNPLILDNFQIKKFFINNKVDSKKFLNFLERLKDMTFRKITGDTRLSVEEQKRLENIIENEKPKDYVEPEVLIPKLQEEIAKTQFTYDCLINENKSKTIEEPNVKPLLLKSNKDTFNEVKKLNTTKKINFVDDINIKNNNNINENDNDFNINIKNNDTTKNKNNNNDKNTNNNMNINTSSIDTTTIPLDTKNIIFKTPRYNIFSRKKTHTTIFMSPLRSKLQSNTSHLADFFNNELDNSNSNSNINKNFDPLFNSKSGKNNNNIFLKRSTINNNSIKIDKELNNSSIFENNKLRLFSPKKRIDFNKFMNNKNKIEEKKENLEINDIEKEQKKEKEKEKEKEQKPEISKIIPKTMKKNNETKDFFKNILSKSHNNNVKSSPKKINIKSKLDFFQKRMPKIIAKKKYKTKTELENEQYQNIENLYNKALHLKSKSFDDQVELENYLMSSKRKQNMSEIMNLKSTYYNIYKMERNFSKNLIKEEYSLRNINLNKSIDFTERQKQILNKNKLFTKAFFSNANKFRMIICKKNKKEDN